MTEKISDQQATEIAKEIKNSADSLKTQLKNLEKDKEIWYKEKMDKLLTTVNSFFDKFDWKLKQINQLSRENNNPEFQNYCKWLKWLVNELINTLEGISWKFWLSLAVWNDNVTKLSALINKAKRYA